MEVVSQGIRNIFPFGHDTSQVVPNQLIVRTVLVIQRLDMVKYVPHLHHLLCGKPQFFPRLVKACLLDVFNLVHSVVLLLSPLEFLVQEVENHKIERPEVVPS